MPLSDSLSADQYGCSVYEIGICTFYRRLPRRNSPNEPPLRRNLDGLACTFRRQLFAKEGNWRNKPAVRNVFDLAQSGRAAPTVGLVSRAPTEPSVRRSSTKLSGAALASSRAVNRQGVAVGASRWPNYTEIAAHASVFLSCIRSQLHDSSIKTLQS